MGSLLRVLLIALHRKLLRAAAANSQNLQSCKDTQPDNQPPTAPFPISFRHLETLCKYPDSGCRNGRRTAAIVSNVWRHRSVVSAS